MVIIKTGIDGSLENFGYAHNSQEAKNYLYSNGYKRMDNGRYFDNDGFEAQIEPVPYVLDAEDY